MANVIMMENQGKYTFKLPRNLASGDYLVRLKLRTRADVLLHSGI